jgi:hypothetical protein
MKRFHQSSIKRKLTSVIMVTSCVALLLACSAFLIYEWSSLRNDMASQMSTLAEITQKVAPQISISIVPMRPEASVKFKQ